MGSFPGHFVRRALGRLFEKEIPAENVNQPWKFEQDSSVMSDSEIETSGLREKPTSVNIPALPDGSAPIQMGSGIITGILGEGGSAVIYEIKNKQLGLQRAVKLLKPQFTRDSYNHFLREFRISIQLSHPNLAVVHTIGQWNKLPFIEMEKITGHSLSDIVTQFGPLPTGLVTAIGIILCKSLEYLHTCTFEIDKKMYAGLLHLDLKPSNILLSDSGVLKIMDFGLSTPTEDISAGLYPKPGIGSPQYAAPELLLGEAPPDVRSDIYSLGCILYELLSGVKTFPGPEEESVLELRSTNTYISLKKFSKSIPANLLRLIEECLSLKKDSRPLNIELIRKDLELIHQSVTGLTPENTIQLYVTKRRQNEPFTLPRPHPTMKKMLLTVVLIVAAVGAAAVGSLMLLQSNRTMGRFLPSFLSFTPNEAVAVNASPAQAEDSTIAEPTPTKPPEAASSTGEGDFYAPDDNSSESILMDSVRQAWNNRKFDVMLALIDQLPEDLAGSKEVLLYKLRSLGRGGEELGKLLAETEVLDGEYFFHKARYQFGNKKYKEALINLEKAQTLPCEFLDKRILGREVQLFKSRLLTNLFRTSPTSENLKAALDSWNRLLELVSDKPDGIQSKEAQKEKQNLLAEAQWRGIS